MSFDPAAFLDATISDSNSTKPTPVPVGDYTGIVESVDVRSNLSRKDPSRVITALDVIWSVEDPNVKALLGREHVTVKQGILLDITNDGRISTEAGANVGLGRLREATGTNEPGRSFSLRDIIGRAAHIHVKHRVDGEDIYAEVGKVAKL